MAETADRGRKRPGGRSARVRDAVLTAALEVLTEDGVENLTIGTIAARASVHETSIYRRWGSLRSLLLDASLHVADDAISIPDTGALRSDLLVLIGHVIALLHTPKGKAMLTLIESHDEDRLRARQEFLKGRFERLQP